MKSISTATRLGIATAAVAGILAFAQPVPAEAAHGGLCRSAGRMPFCFGR
jgi:hypothetical protein